MITDKYTEQELREAWRIVLNSPNLSNWWKDYHSMMTWDLLEDDYLLDLLELTLGLFRDREYKDGAKNACDLWIQDLKQPLEILSKKAPLYSSYVNTHSESELSIEKLTELGHLSDDEIEALQTAGVLAKAIKEPRDYFKLSYLYYKAEFFNAYCTGLQYQIHRDKQERINSLEEIKKITGEIDKSVTTLVESMNTKTKEVPIEQKENNKKYYITRLQEYGLITKSERYEFREIEGQKTKCFLFYVTEKFTPENIRKCLDVERVPWGIIADFKQIISRSTKEPLTKEELSDIAFNKARKKK